MPPAHPDNYGLSALTVDQAAALFTCLLRDPQRDTSHPHVFAFVIQPTQREDPMSPAPAWQPNPCDLIRLGKPVLDLVPELVTFYLIGRAFHDGATSLRAVAREFAHRDVNGQLPARVPTSVSLLSRILFRLETNVFSLVFSEPEFKILSIPGGGGTPGTLSTNGERAWAETVKFLVDYYDLPQW